MDCNNWRLCPLILMQKYVLDLTRCLQWSKNAPTKWPLVWPPSAQRKANSTPKGKFCPVVLNRWTDSLLFGSTAVADFFKIQNNWVDLWPNVARARLCFWTWSLGAHSASTSATWTSKTVRSLRTPWNFSVHA